MLKPNHENAREPSLPPTHKGFEALGLESGLLATLTKLGHTQPTRIQTLAIPQVLQKRDLIAIAQTGTGKTAAFALPLLQQLMNAENKTKVLPRGLILTPTRELALQVFTAVNAYAETCNIQTLVIHGGVSYDPQIEKLKAGVDIVIATPGRLRDHLEQKNIDLSHVECLVLDEADRMLDMGFIEDVALLIEALPKGRQTLLFSATFSDEIKTLAQKYLRKPLTIHATPQTVTATKISHIIHPVDTAQKMPLLLHLLKKHCGPNDADQKTPKEKEQVLIFTRTKVKADEVAKDITAAGFRCMATHSGRTQAYRTKAMAHFKENKIQILVATDIAARGLDILDLNIVINYEIPHLPEDYVHRIGRTGRAGAEGLAISLVTQSELYLLAPIEQLIKTVIPQIWLEGFIPKNFDPRAIPRSKLQRGSSSQKTSSKGPSSKKTARKPRKNRWN